MKPGLQLPEHGDRQPLYDRGLKARPTWGQQLPALYTMWAAGIPVWKIAETLGRRRESVLRRARQKELGPHPGERTDDEHSESIPLSAKRGR